MAEGVEQDASDQPKAATFYYDYSSAYAYLAVHRLDDVLGIEPEWYPVWLPAIFAATGRRSWFFTDRRAEGVAEVMRRAERYGIPFASHDTLMEKLVPRGSLLAQRAGIVAMQAGKLVPYSREVTDRFNGRGEDITDPAMIAAAAESAGLDGEETIRRCGDQDVKDEVKRLTQEAIDRGVVGVPTVAVGDQLFWGDDRLEEAAAALRG
jgi:2-hydroxychromene-2-carboxylate isomerase